MRSLLLILHLLAAFSLFLEGTLGKPFVQLVHTYNSTCLDVKAIPACFGLAFLPKHFTGYLVEAVPANACQPIQAPPAFQRPLERFIVLIQRYDCSFATKVLHAQEAGYRAAIVHNINSDFLVSMAEEVEEMRAQVFIPSLFIGQSDAKLLKKVLHSENRTRITAVVPWDYHNPCWDDADISFWDPARHHLQVWPGYCTQEKISEFLQKYGLVFLVSMVMVVLIAASFVKWCRRKRGIRMKTFKRGDAYDLCVICMVEYEEGDRLEILPCTHAYHHMCINTWFLTQPRAERTCPICKQKVSPAT
ncbi:E3 ubiquitin-protein ligase ZNRF4-like [Hemicordylus capensis]|uniref:E3 ubiquitin-protein ligase ZNRF4-like n=1 Tax=Hemicordylus capensis TaxID=884348 RepID=UPI0023022FC5|nr:E3 ubiquitin-protein ligase ZNRF4-like [Hemicordylus capensis]